MVTNSGGSWVWGQGRMMEGMGRRSLGVKPDPSAARTLRPSPLGNRWWGMAPNKAQKRTLPFREQAPNHPVSPAWPRLPSHSPRQPLALQQPWEKRREVNVPSLSWPPRLSAPGLSMPRELILKTGGGAAADNTHWNLLRGLLLHSPAVQPWTSPLASLSLGFLPGSRGQ